MPTGSFEDNAEPPTFDCSWDGEGSPFEEVDNSYGISDDIGSVAHEVNDCMSDIVHSMMDVLDGIHGKKYTRLREYMRLAVQNFRDMIELLDIALEEPDPDTGFHGTIPIGDRSFILSDKLDEETTHISLPPFVAIGPFKRLIRILIEKIILESERVGEEDIAEQIVWEAEQALLRGMEEDDEYVD